MMIESPETEQLARELAELTGKSIDQVVAMALRDGVAKARDMERRRAKIAEIQRRVAALPVLDPRTPDEIIGYDETGVPR